jgi:hypothetical protein
MSRSQETEDRIRAYFRAKTAQLKALAGLAVCEHSGLIGGHREEVHRVYLREVLPKRYSVGRGMIYGPFHRSREVDIVVWDELNYTSLPLLDHSFFFAESVRLALECKSVWTAEEMNDVLLKIRAIRDVIPMHEPTLSDSVMKLAIEIEALRSGTQSSGLMITPPHIGTAAIFLTGGESFGPDFVAPRIVAECDDAWPDVLILLGPGRIVLKKYRPDDSLGNFGGIGSLEFYDCGDDSLLIFSSIILSLLEERSVITESPFSLMRYTPTVATGVANAAISFPVTRPIPGRVPLWR